MTDDREPVTAEQRARLDELASVLGQTLPDRLDRDAADQLIRELTERADRGGQTYSSE